MKTPILSPSLLSADFLHLSDALKKIENTKSSGDVFVHIDVMDGIFVPQISYGQPIIKSLRKATELVFDVHLMIEHPENHIDSFIDCGADYITFHYENTVHIDRIIQHIHERGKKAGIAIVPTTPVSVLSEILPLVDLVLVMTVNPGFGGQKLIPYCLKKVEKLVELKRNMDYNYLISVDGGVNDKTLPAVLEAGTEVVVSGSSFFNDTLNWKG
ncbi:MAG: ribulose-phosphate 3-epimerase [Treponema sp.]|nr:ribulose-phosphate 3-epimerase [Treponema sp.]